MQLVLVAWQYFAIGEHTEVENVLIKVPETIKRRRELIEHHGASGSQPVGIAVGALASCFEDGVWLDDIKWLPNGPTSFTIQGRLKAQSKLYPELRPGRYVEVPIYDVRDWRIGE